MAYTYPQLQVGQAQLQGGPVTLGDGSLIVDQGPISGADVTNLTTSAVIGHVLAADALWSFGDYAMYKFRHAAAVSEDDRVLLSVDGTPKTAFGVRKYTIAWGGVSVTSWDLFKEQDL